MLQRKIITLDRKTGKPLSEMIAGEAKMTQEQYFKPFVELYKESVNQLDIKIRQEEMERRQKHA